MAQGDRFVTSYWLQPATALVLLYVVLAYGAGAPYLYTHMLRQRRNRLGVKRTKRE